MKQHWRFARPQIDAAQAAPNGFGRKLIADDSGAIAMEFGLIGPMMIALVLGILNIALIFLAQQGLQSTVEEAGRIVMTGQAQNASMTQAQFKTAACAKLPPFMSCNRLYVDVNTAASYATATTGRVTLTYNASGVVTNTMNYTLGSRGDIVVVRLMYLWPTAASAFAGNLVTDQGGNRLITAVTVLKTEYY
ncbi:pilus assembly protein [Novosphingobium sp. FSY-8]|uniref:Pilus assembly protein n=1 Tax=Novosphingobium ovatum TaxID=1908523 RepID=A0ABW9XEH9_9SPHN|nr:TadE/TadG family type IV pilus assembly protein [Novosphingobium ovatum]NBC36944.1 pilus assembly protein [Novosphingobium ovatum]